jgi:flagellar assembly protein FliH
MAGVIKSGQMPSGGALAQAAAFNFEDLARKADGYLESFRQKAAQILAEANQHANQIRQQARQQGQLEAQRQAEQSAQSELARRLETLFPALDQAISSIRQARESWLAHWERNTVRLACAVAEKIVRRELTQTPEISLVWLREALELVTSDDRVSVYLHPQDVDTLGDQVRLLIGRLSRLGAAQLIADPGVEPGGCRVETEFGCIDQQLSTQLARITEELAG